MEEKQGSVARKKGESPRLGDTHVPPCLATSAMNLCFRLAALAIMVNRIVDLRAFQWAGVMYFAASSFDASDTIKNMQPNSFDWHEGKFQINILPGMRQSPIRLTTS